MSWIDLCGYLAATCTTAAYLPQAVKAWRTRSTRDLSLGMLAVLVAGIALWLAYGIGKSDPPLILANTITLTLAGALVALKLRHG